MSLPEIPFTAPSPSKATVFFPSQGHRSQAFYIDLVFSPLAIHLLGRRP
jgi:hypothetical protein